MCFNCIAFVRFRIKEIFSVWMLWLFFVCNSVKSIEDNDIVTAFIYTLAKIDTDKNNRLTGGDKVTIALSSPSGRDFTEIAAGIDAYLDYSIVDADHITVFYRREHAFFAALVDLRTRRVLLEREIAAGRENER